MPQLSRRFAIAALMSVLGLVVQAAPPAAPMVTASSPANPALAATAPKAFTQPGQMYLDDQAHANDKLDLTPGGPPTVPYQPRSSDRWSVGGQPARAIPLTSSSTGSSGSSGTGSSTTAQTGTAPLTSTTTSTSTPGLGREVFGFLGYWGLTDPIDYTGLTTLAYFGVDATSSGGFASNSGLTGWNSSALTNVIDTAHSNGVRVVLVVKCFAWTSSGTTTCSTLLSSATARQKLADTIAAQVAARDVDGVNFDFEPIPQSSAESANFVDLVRRTRAALDQKALGYEVTVDSLGWIGPASYQTTYGYDVAGLTAPGGADAMVIMGYDYKGAFQSAAGSIDPLSGPAYDLTDTVNAYLQFTDPGHVILALPWYGRAWSTTTSSAGSATVAGTSSQPSEPCSVAVDYWYVVEQMLPPNTPTWYTTEQSPYLGYSQPPTTCHPNTTDWRQLYYDDVQSLGLRYDLVNATNLRGTGMWDVGKVVGADGLHPELYDLIKSKFTAPPSVYDGPPTTFTPVGPTRVLDTRVGTGLSGRLQAGHHRTLTLSNLPAGAVAVTLNVTVVGQTAAGYVSVGPDPTDSASTSTLNFPTRDVRANGTTVRLGTGNTINLLYSAPAGASTNLVIDLTGVYTTGSGATFTPVGPTRVLDTRVGTGGALTPFKAGVVQTLRLSGVAGIPAGAVAVTLNVTVVGQTAAGYISLGPAGTAIASTSTLNFPIRDIRANGATVPLSSDGSLGIVYMGPAGSTANVILDLTGYLH